MAHGYAKLMKGPDVFVGILHVIGVPAPHLMAWLTILVELFGGLAVLLGAFVPLVSLPMAAVLLVAIFTVHLPYGFTSIKLMAVTAAGPQFGPPGYETDLLYLACLASLLMSGPGPLSIRLARWPWRQESRKADRSRRASVRASPYQTPFLRRTDMLRKTLVALAATASLAAGTLLFTGIATSSGVARAALQPVDPAHAPVAAVDRFNDKAGTLLLRSTDTRLPGPNEPIDFDTPPLNNLGFTPTGERTLYYRLDVQSTTPAPVYILYREGEDKPVASQLDIIDTLPGEKGYNDFRQVWKVWVPKDYVANTIADASMLQQAGYKMEKTDKLLNMAVVPDKSRARVRFNGGSTELQSAWYRDQVAKFFLFDEVPLSVSGDKVPVSPIYEGFTINPGQPGGEMKFCTDPNPTQTSHNVVATVPGDKAYSPLWLRVVYDSAACASVHNLDTALKAKVVPARVLIINCPIVSIEH